MQTAHLSCFVVALSSSTAFAQNPVPPPPPSESVTRVEQPAPSDDRRITIMWAPLRALFGLAEFTGEYGVTDKIGVSLQLGAGRRTLTFATGGSMTDVRGTELEVGLQGRYYVLGSFTHGMELGVEVLDEYVTFDEPLPPGVVGVAAGGVTAGAFVGYKVVARLGFTFEGQLGARYLVADPAVTGMGTPMVENADKWMPLLHLNAGWTF